MKKITLLSATVLMLPALVHAQTFQNFLTNFNVFLTKTILPFVMALAFAFFIINVIRFLIIDSANEEGREKAKALAIYGVGAFIFIVVISGIVNLLISSVGIGGVAPTKSDYMLLP